MKVDEPKIPFCPECGNLYEAEERPEVRMGLRHPSIQTKAGQPGYELWPHNRVVLGPHPTGDLKPICRQCDPKETARIEGKSYTESTLRKIRKTHENDFTGKKDGYYKRTVRRRGA